MAIIRIYPSQDTSICDYDPGSPSANTLYSNIGAAEILNMYKWGSTRAEILIKFPQDKIATIPSGSQVMLKLFNAVHSQSLPAGYTTFIRPLEQDWTEGNGLDTLGYTDIGPASFYYATTNTTWSLGTGTLSASAYFTTGLEDLNVDVTHLTGVMQYGLDIMTDPFDPGNLYIKKFHSRQTHFLNRVPYLEARWADWTGSLTTASLFYVNTGDYSGTYWPASMASSSVSSSGLLVTSYVADVDPVEPLIFSIDNFKPIYDRAETPKMKVFIRRKDWNPAVVLTASLGTGRSVLTNAYYRVVDVVTDINVIPFGTGSIKYTKLSYNDSGSYFDFNMNNLSVGSLYRFDLAYESPTGSGNWAVMIGDHLKFRVTETIDG